MAVRASTPTKRSPSARPLPIWHPVPVSEIAMAAGVVALVVGLVTTEPVVLAVGIGAMMLGVVELTLREHVTGYRSHKLILAAATAVAVHMGIVALAPFKLIGPGALALDLVLFGAGLAVYDALWKRAVRLRTPAKTSSYPRRARRR